MMVWPVRLFTARSADVRTRLVVSQPDMIEAMVRINSEERKVDGRIGALYRFCRGLQGNQIDQINQTNQINSQSSVLGLSG
jgi:hypothetical protein